jgi:hypothetical protein
MEAAFWDSPSSELAIDIAAAELACGRVQSVQKSFVKRSRCPPPLGKLTGPFTWFEPDFSELARILRHVYEHREAAGQCGRLAGNHVRQHFAWPRITQMYLDRIDFLMPH